MYFKSILPTTFFAPAQKRDIFNCPVNEQFDGLKEIYDDVLRNYHHNLYLFYNFWTGFLYALSRSNIVELVCFTWINKLIYSKNKTERIVSAFIWAYFLKFLYRYIKLGKNNSCIMNIPLLNSIANILLEHGYMESNNKQKIIEDVLSEIIESEHNDLGDFLKMVLEILKHSTSLDQIVGANH